ncbi:hypothetical protein PSY80_24560, partial [Shigella flexneri]|nr:hypothetical protein [Shigella flexneri]
PSRRTRGKKALRLPPPSETRHRKEHRVLLFAAVPCLSAEVIFRISQIRYRVIKRLLKTLGLDMNDKVVIS